MEGDLVQVSRRSGVVKRVPVGEHPMVELRLTQNQTIVSFRVLQVPPKRDRVTVDWRWTAWVATRLV
jgi:hypothetical protein